MSASGESFLHYRKRLEKNERYQTWRVEHAKTFYVPHNTEAKIGGYGYGIRWDTAVDTAFRVNTRHYDIPALEDED